jgi:transposase InsO family protein
MDHYESHGRNAALTSRYFGISRETFHRWRRRYDPGDLTTLEDRSHRPRRCRRPTWTNAEIEAVRRIRGRYPRWGKKKLAVLLEREGLVLAPSRIGRILADLKRRRLLVEPPSRGISARKRRPPRPYAVRKPKDWPVRAPGDLVELDTLDVRPLPDALFKHFTARDVVCRWDVLEAHRHASAQTATTFLDAVLARMPFPVRAFQVDGGSEFRAGFEDACRDRKIRLFVLPPRSPRLNGHVERAQGTHTTEFYELYDGPLNLDALNRALRRWEHVYNHVRPHQSLEYRTPREFLADWRAASEAPPSAPPGCPP